MTARTITGLAVPYGPAGRTSAGKLRFDAMSLSWSHPERVKLLIEHDQNRVIGHALTLEHTDAGLVGTFAVDDTPEAAAALASASRMVRDGLSIGAELTDETTAALGRSPGAGVLARGQLREVSLVAVPAFDDSRVSDVEAGGTDLSAAAAAATPTTTTPGGTMSHLTTAAGPLLATASAPTGLGVAIGALAHATTTASATPPAEPAPAGTPVTSDTPAVTAGAPAAATAAAPDTLGPVETPAPAPALAAGSVHTVNDAPTYTLDGRGHSYVRDAFAVQAGDLEAMARLAAFNRALADDDSRQLAVFAGLAARVQANGRLAEAAVDVRDAGNDALRPDTNRTDLLIRAIDAGRPLVSQVRSMPISGPDPFRLPVFGRFDGVADHTEGQPHVAEGTVDDVGSQVITPTAVSGAYRISRELAESNGPRYDQLVTAEMVTDYRNQSEARLVATLEVVKAAADATGNTPEFVLSQLIAFYGIRQRSATVIAAGTTAYSALATVKASDGRPYFPYLNPGNAAGTSSAGLVSLNIQGVPGIPAWSADLADLWMLNGEDAAVFESAPRLFRFEEVEGPGVIKFAIWGYQASHVFRREGVRRLAWGA